MNFLTRTATIICSCLSIIAVIVLCGMSAFGESAQRNVRPDHWQKEEAMAYLNSFLQRSAQCSVETNPNLFKLVNKELENPLVVEALTKGGDPFDQDLRPLMRKILRRPLVQILKLPLNRLRNVQEISGALAVLQALDIDEPQMMELVREVCSAARTNTYHLPGDQLMKLQWAGVYALTHVPGYERMAFEIIGWIASPDLISANDVSGDLFGRAIATNDTSPGAQFIVARELFYDLHDNIKRALKYFDGLQSIDPRVQAIITQSMLYPEVQSIALRATPMILQNFVPEVEPAMIFDPERLAFLFHQYHNDGRVLKSIFVRLENLIEKGYFRTTDRNRAMIRKIVRTEIERLLAHPPQNALELDFYFDFLRVLRGIDGLDRNFEMPLAQQFASGAEINGVSLQSIFDYKLLLMHLLNLIALKNHGLTNSALELIYHAQIHYQFVKLGGLGSHVYLEFLRLNLSNPGVQKNLIEYLEAAQKPTPELEMRADEFQLLLRFTREMLSTSEIVVAPEVRARMLELLKEPRMLRAVVELEPEIISLLEYPLDETLLQAIQTFALANDHLNFATEFQFAPQLDTKSQQAIQKRFDDVSSETKTSSLSARFPQVPHKSGNVVFLKAPLVRSRVRDVFAPLVLEELRQQNPDSELARQLVLTAQRLQLKNVLNLRPARTCEQLFRKNST